MKSISISILVLIIVSSCATHQGSISSSAISGNFKYEDIVFGISQTEKYFGIGGISRDALVLEAKQNMITNRPLGRNEEYANYTLDFKRTYFLFYNQTKVTMSADVIKFVNDTSSNPYSETYKNKIFKKRYVNDLFSVGDSIIDGNLNEGAIISFTDTDQVKVMYTNQQNHIRTGTVSIYSIYAKNKSYKGFKIGDYCIEIFRNTSGERRLNVKVLGVGLNSVLIKDDNGVIRPIKAAK